MGHRDKKDCIEVGDLVVVIYPFMDWKWQRYKIGDIGIVLGILSRETYAIAKIKLFRTEKIESVPLEYVALVGEKNETRRPSDFK